MQITIYEAISLIASCLTVGFTIAIFVSRFVSKADCRDKRSCTDASQKELLTAVKNLEETNKASLDVTRQILQTQEIRLVIIEQALKKSGAIVE